MGYGERDESKISISIGSRTYIFNIKASRAGKRYLEIIENTQVSPSTVERRSIVLFEAGFEIFSTALNRAVKDLAVKEAYLNRMEETRAMYENAYKLWPPEDDLKLRELYCEGKSLEELMSFFKRNKNGITARIEKLGLNPDMIKNQSDNFLF